MQALDIRPALPAIAVARFWGYNEAMSAFLGFSFVLSFLFLTILTLNQYLPTLVLFNIGLSVFYAVSILLLFLLYRSKAPVDIRNLANPNQAPILETLPKQRFNKELEMATRVQEKLLDLPTPDLPGIRIAKRCVPAKNIGGDFYTFITQDSASFSTRTYESAEAQKHLGIAIGDVAGHGLSSALIMALSSGVFAEIGKQEFSPGKLLRLVNTAINRFIQASHISHVTAFYVVLNLKTKELSFAKAGHPSALLIRDRQIIELDADGVFLGMFQEQEFEEKKIQLQSGDRIVLYTDGITETKGVTGEFYEEERLQEQLIRYSDQPIGQVLNAVYDDVSKFSQAEYARDDQTMVIMEVV